MKTKKDRETLYVENPETHDITIQLDAEELDRLTGFLDNVADTTEARRARTDSSKVASQ